MAPQKSPPPLAAVITSRASAPAPAVAKGSEAVIDFRRPSASLTAVAAALSASQPCAVVGYFRDKSLEGDLIAWDGGSWWDHATSYITPLQVIDARDDQTTATGINGKPVSIPAGVQIRPASYLDENQYALIVAIDCQIGQLALRNAALHSQVGQPYDKPGIEDFATGRIFDPSWRGTKHPWFCDELELWALKQGNIIRPQLLPFFRDTPGTAEAIVMATACSRVIYWRGELLEQLAAVSGFALPIIQS